MLPPRVANRLKMLLTVMLSHPLTKVRHDSMRQLRDYVEYWMHLYASKQLAAARELCDSLMAVLWDESLIMPLQPPAKRRRTVVA